MTARTHAVLEFLDSRLKQAKEQAGDAQRILENCQEELDSITEPTLLEKLRNRRAFEEDRIRVCYQFSLEAAQREQTQRQKALQALSTVLDDT